MGPRRSCATTPRSAASGSRCDSKIAVCARREHDHRRPLRNERPHRRSDDRQPAGQRSWSRRARRDRRRPRSGERGSASRCRGPDRRRQGFLRRRGHPRVQYACVIGRTDAGNAHPHSGRQQRSPWSRRSAASAWAAASSLRSAVTSGSRTPDAQVALPEVKLGLLPGRGRHATPAARRRRRDRAQHDRVGCTRAGAGARRHGAVRRNRLR